MVHLSTDCCPTFHKQPSSNPTTWVPSPYQQRVTPGLTVSLRHHSFQELSGSKVVQPSYVTCNDIAQTAIFHIHASLPSRKRSSRNMFSGHLHTSLHQAAQISCSYSWLTTASCTTPYAKPKCMKVWYKATLLFLWISSSIAVVSHSTLKVLACYVYHCLCLLQKVYTTLHCSDGSQPVIIHLNKLPMNFGYRCAVLREIL
jgi:hypothetical protein